jgi:DNA-binding FrmR family transcriptional regulator
MEDGLRKPPPPSQAGATGRYWYPEELVRRLRRVEGQARGLQALIQRGADCDQLETQLAAMQGALDGVRRIVEMCRVAEHLDRTVGPLDPDAVRRSLVGLRRGSHTPRGMAGSPRRKEERA